MIHTPLRIVLLGPPGAGKGTQASRLSRNLELLHISTGDIMRREIESESEVGKEVKTYLSGGVLVPDAVVIRLLKGQLEKEKSGKGFVLDGFPRTVDQAKALSILLEEMDQAITHVLEIKVPESFLITRILNRGKSGSGRPDDTEEIVKKRLEVYHSFTAPVTEYYKNTIGVREIEGIGTVGQVYSGLLAAIDYKLAERKKEGVID